MAHTGRGKEVLPAPSTWNNTVKTTTQFLIKRKQRKKLKSQSKQTIKLLRDN